MAGPWERYQRVDGPWTRYAKSTAAPAATPQAPVDLGPVQTINDTPEPGTLLRNLQVGAQGAGRAFADVAGFPVDMAAALTNIGILGINQFLDNDLPYATKPFLGSESISDAAGTAARAVGVPMIDEEDMVGSEVYGYNVNRFGAGALTGAAGTMKAAAKPATTRIGQAFQRLAEPYRHGTAAITGDVGAGVGAGLANATIDQGHFGETGDSPLGRMLATIIGGIGGATVTNAGEGLVKGARNVVRNAVQGPDPNAPVNPTTGRQYTRNEMDRAAAIAQDMPSDRTRAAQNIRDADAEFAGRVHDADGNPASPFSDGPPVPKGARPTVGMMADDVGMALDENAARVRDPKPFIDQDNRRHAFIASDIDNSVPPGARSRDLTDFGNTTVDDMRRVSDAAIGSAADVQDDVARRSAAEANSLSAYARSQGEISGRIAEAWNTVLDNLRGRKNTLYNNADPRAPVEGTPLYNRMRNIRNSVPEAGRVGAFEDLYGRVMQRLRGTDPQTGAPTIRDITYGDIAEWLAQSRQTRQEIVAAGGDPRNLDRIRSALGQIADEMNPEAAAFYRDEYLPRAKTGIAGQYENLRKRAARTGEASTATRPEDFANRFFRKPSDVRQFLTSMGDDLDDETRRAVSEWMAGDLAKAAGTPSNPGARVQAMRRWRDRNSAVLDMLPEARSRVDAEISRAARLAEEAVGARRGVEDARQSAAHTEAQIKRTSLGQIYDKDPAKAVASVLGSGDPERSMADLINRVGQNPEARAGLKAAVRDYLVDQIRTTRSAVGTDSYRVSRAALMKMFKKHEAALSRVYTPKEMNALRRMHKLLDIEGNLDAKATAGSNTIDKVANEARTGYQRRMRVLEGALKAKFGVLKGGGILRTINVFMESLPDARGSTDEILARMWFDPDLAVHLLERPLKDVGTPGWNKRLNRLLAAGAGAREMTEEQPSP